MAALRVASMMGHYYDNIMSAVASEFLTYHGEPSRKAL